MAALDNPILNTPFAAPGKHWVLDGSGKPTGEIVEERRRSEYIVAVATSKRKRGGQEELIFEDDAVEPRANDRINAIRAEVDKWRAAPEASWNVTYETARLLKHWRSTKDCDRPLFFCQVEAAETIIWLTEVASKAAGGHLGYFEEVGEAANPGLFRLAMKLATGAGKTTVMAMLIAWQAINKASRATGASLHFIGRRWSRNGNHRPASARWTTGASTLRPRFSTS